MILLFSTEIYAYARVKPAAVIDYLTTYGYIDEDSNSSEDITSKGLSKFQKFMGLQANGRLTKVTKKLIYSPRCGEPDIIHGTEKIPSLIEKIMKKRTITYKIKKWTKWIPTSIQNQTIYNMLKMWSDDLSVKCRWSAFDPDVVIMFNPEKNKRIEAKSKNKYDVYTKLQVKDNVVTINLFADAAQSVSILTKTSAHAFGHVFGHKHSNLYGIMSPIFRPNSIMENGKCEVRLTASFTHLHIGWSYLIKDNLAWGIQEGYEVQYPPKKATDIWKGVPPNIDDGFSWGNNWETYFFQGSQYYRFDTSKGRVADGYPNDIIDGWPGVPNDIDAVFSDEIQKTFFFKQNKVYLFNDELNRVEQGFPKRIGEVFQNVPNFIDAAFHYYADDTVYFFQDLYYWRLTKLTEREKDMITKKKVKFVKRVALGPFLIKYDWHNLCTEV